MTLREITYHGLSGNDAREAIRAHWTRTLPLDACREALEWCQGYPTLDAAWAACEHGDWMVWLVERRGLGTRTAPAERTYDDALDSAGRAYDAASASARRAFVEAIRAVVSATEVAEVAGLPTTLGGP